MNVSPAAVAIAPSPVSTGAVTGALREAIAAWGAQARRDAFPRDSLWIYFTCDACSESYQCLVQLAHSPWTSGDPPPLYYVAADVKSVLERALQARPEGVDADEWLRTSACACGAPRHHQRATASALLCDVPGTGAAAIALLLHGELEWLRAPDGAGTAQPFDPSAFDVAFGRPFSLFDSWLELAPSLPMSEGKVSGVAAEPGVLLFAASNERDIDAGIRGKLGMLQRFTVRIEADVPKEIAWPPSLRALADHIAAGNELALVVDRRTMLAQARAWAKVRLDATIEDAGEEWMLDTDRGRWAIAPTNIALLMARAGRMLASACAQEIDEAARAIDDRIATLRAMTELLPGSSFTIEGTTATATRAGGEAGRSIELEAIPAGAGGLRPETLAREAAFLFDVAPSWADRSRVCSCGAAADLERRLIGFPLATDTPWVLATWGGGAAHAAEVVAICCDRHARIPSKRELVDMGVDEARARAAGTNVSRARVRARTCVREEEKIVFVRGPLLSGVVVSDARVRALHDTLGRPFGSERLSAWALGTEVLALAKPETPDERIPAALAETAVTIHGAFWIRREVDLSVDPLGAFDVVSE